MEVTFSEVKFKEMMLILITPNSCKNYNIYLRYIPPGSGDFKVTRNLLASQLNMNIEALDKMQSEKHNLMERESLVDKRFKEQH